MLKEDLTAGSVPRHLVRLAIPMFFGISSMMVASMIDTVYIGWIGTVELAAVSFSFPVVMALSSVSMGLGVGATSIISRTLGGGDRQRALVLGSHTLLLVTVFVVTLAVLGFTFVEPIFRTLGADEVTLSLLVPYMRIWFFGLPLFAVPMVAMSMLRAFGNARTPGVLMTGGALLQVLIAPGLIFGLPGPGDGIGYLGSAWAFVLSRVLVFAATMGVLSRRGLFQPVGAWSAVFASWREVLRIGVPSILTNLIGPASMAVVFGLLARHGHEVVAGFGVAVRIESLALMILMAFSSSLGPLVGQNLGARRHDRINAALRFGYRFAFGWGLFAFVVLAALGRPIVALINDHAGVIEATYAYLVPVALSYGFLGTSMVVGSTFLAFGRATPSLVLALMRMLVLYLPLAWLGDALWGYRGIFFATAFCNVIVAVAGFFWLRSTLSSAVRTGGPHSAR